MTRRRLKAMAADGGSRMIDVRLKADFFAHPKTKKLRRQLGDGAVLSLQGVWLYAAANRPDGDLAGLSDEDIELAGDWSGEPGALVRVLREIGFVDGEEDGRQIHDWIEHQPFVAGSRERAERARAAAQHRWAARASGRPEPEDAMQPAEASQCECDAPSDTFRTNRTEENVGAHGKNPRSGKRKTVAWPPELTLTPAMRTFAAERGIDPESEFLAWRDDCHAHDRRYIDWQSAWRNRIRNVPRFGGVANGAASQPATLAPKSADLVLKELMDGDQV